MKQQISYKNFFIKYGTFMSVLLVLFFLMIYSIVVSRKSWSKNLCYTIERFLNEKDSNSWVLSSQLHIKNPFVMNAAAFDARNNKDGEMYKAVILRVQTFYGPLAGVFIVDKNNNVEFVGYPSLHGAISEQIKIDNSNKRIDYWKNKIPEIIK